MQLSLSRLVDGRRDRHLLEDVFPLSVFNCIQNNGRLCLACLTTTTIVTYQGSDGYKIQCKFP